MERLKLALIVSGFPSETKPSHSLFNKIGAENLSEYADVSVVQFSLWKPGKKFVKIFPEGTKKYKHFRISIPFPSIYSETSICMQFKLFEKVASRSLVNVFKGVDIIHSVGAHLGGVMGSRLGRIFQKPNVLQLIGSDVNVNLPKMKDYRCFKNFMSWTQGVGCNTLELKKRFVELMGKAPYMPVIYNGVNINKFPFCKREHTNNSKIKFLFLGGIPLYKYHNNSRNLKGGMTLLEAWKENEELLYKNGCKLIFAGPDSDHEIAGEFLSSLKYKDSVILKGYLTHDEVRTHMEDSDVVLIPSLEEGMPNVAMEAGAMGKCIIASNVGGLPEIISSYENGILVEQGNVKSLKEAMAFIIKNKSVIENYSFKIRKVVEMRFNSNNFAPQYMELYKKVLEISQ